MAISKQFYGLDLHTYKVEMTVIISSKPPKYQDLACGLEANGV